MKSKRITFLCSSLGKLNERNIYIPGDDCIVNLDELAHSVFKEDAVQRNVSAQAFQNGVFERDLIQIIHFDDDHSYTALKALAAFTTPLLHHVEQKEYHEGILLKYKKAIASNEKVISKRMSFLFPMMNNDHPSENDRNRSELVIVFLRNIALITSSSDIHERIMQIYSDNLVFQVLALIPVLRFGTRDRMICPYIACLLSGCFTPYLPLEKLNQKESKLGSLLAELKKKEKPSPHEKCGSTVSVVKMSHKKKKVVSNHAGPISSLCKNSPMPTGHRINF
jgi:hypothetical protein